MFFWKDLLYSLSAQSDRWDYFSTGKLFSKSFPFQLFPEVPADCMDTFGGKVFMTGRQDLKDFIPGDALEYIAQFPDIYMDGNWFLGIYQMFTGFLEHIPSVGRDIPLQTYYFGYEII